MNWEKSVIVAAFSGPSNRSRGLGSRVCHSKGRRYRFKFVVVIKKLNVVLPPGRGGEGGGGERGGGGKRRRE